MGNAIVSQTVGNTTDYYESPAYTVVEEKDGYELRKYETSVWTSAQMGKVDADVDEASDEKMNSKAFWSLFNYISGKTNEEKQKVSMTTPVLVKNDENLGLKMSFYLPAENREKPPNPSETHVATDSWPETIFYVRKFSPPNSKIAHFLVERDAMAAAMAKDGLKLKDNFEWMRAGYDPPFKIANRRSEVWIPVDQVVGPDLADSMPSEAPPADIAATAASIPVEDAC